MNHEALVDQASHQAKQGVGVRHEKATTAHGGGGYQNNCNDSETRPIGLAKNSAPLDLFLGVEGKRYLDEISAPLPGERAKPVPEVLQSLHLAPVWQRVAAEFGLPFFMELWQVLDQYAPKEGDRARIDLPSKKSLAKLQRNQVIKLSASQGLKPKQIESVCKKLGYRDVSERTIYRETNL